MTEYIGGPRLFNCMRDILQHIVEFIEDDFLSSIFMSDYSTILCDHITTVTSYCHLFGRQVFGGKCFFFGNDQGVTNIY